MYVCVVNECRKFSKYLTIRQRGRIGYEPIDYLFRDNEAELSNCFSIHPYPKCKLKEKLEKLENFDKQLL